ncbi:hypothetical protein [Mesorhizobium cantuariense]|uniref:MarR family transcriptional regulator n=1 Tax=Mesorhizobium cantuariense TaxID=1300275 RepID=A0ABV7MZV8_9HYPH
MQPEVNAAADSSRQSWDAQEIEELVRLMRKFADALGELPDTGA